MTPVALDAMGGDRAPAAMVEGAARAAREGVSVVLVGDEAQIAPLIPSDVALPIVHASQIVEMGESPSAAVRSKKDASIRVAARMVKEGEACALVSCGNTGAVMAASLMELGRVKGVERPAITAVVPRIDGGQLVILDLGANVDCKPSQLGQFGVMGQMFAQHVLGIQSPRVGLLSNGEEASKGNEQVRAAMPMLERMPFEFVGQVEPTDAFHGACEVLVCDGFVGNVMLKSVEATVEIAAKLLKDEISRWPSAKVGAWLLKGAFRRYRNRTRAAALGGAHLLGVSGTVVVGHGRSDGEAVANAIRQAHQTASEQLVERIGSAVAATLEHVAAN